MAISVKRISSIAQKLIPADVRSTTTKLTGAMQNGYKIGKRYNSIYGSDKTITSLQTSAKSVGKELSKLSFKQDEMPALAAAITYLIPIPSPIPLTPIVYGLGHLINKAVKILK